MGKSRSRQKPKQQQQPCDTSRGSDVVEFDRKKESSLGTSWMFPGHNNSKTPDDFITNPETGKRSGDSREPWGNVTVDLSDGIPESVTIPPTDIWADGEWLEELEKKNPDLTKRSDSWNTWVVSGEGTPGNYRLRLYKVPKQIAVDPLPDHPADWPADLRKKKKGNGGASYSGYSGYSSYSGTRQVGTTGGKKVTATQSSMPYYGVYARCQGCGHFFDMDDLSKHAKFTCPGVQLADGGIVNFVMECECHPKNLQAAATPIEGFPKQLATSSNGKQTDDTADEMSGKEEAKA